MFKRSMLSIAGLLAGVSGALIQRIPLMRDPLRLRTSPGKQSARHNRSNHLPHQGEREMARRRRQLQNPAFRKAHNFTTTSN